MKSTVVRLCSGLVLASLSAIAGAQSEVACEMPDGISGASYQVVRQSGEGGTTEEETQTLLLLRSANRVMHIHPAQHTADVWERNAHGGVHFSRFYDSRQRGIEFYQGVAAEPSSQLSWDQAYQLLPTAVLSENEIQSVRAAPGCARVESYRYTVEGDTYTLEWLPAQQLVLSLTVDRGLYHMTWTLEYVVAQPDRLNEEMRMREAYITIDYADLGDQESDPFFRSLKHGSDHH
ncbi:Uncharacterised protein [Halioglobus japonicus]|nr:Uncharacterised protein [Halioglobus japonicus]